MRAGSSRADGGSVSAGTDLRGRPAAGAIRLPGGALDAVRRVHRLPNTGHREVVDANLSNYFGEVPHAGLLRSVARRGGDGRLPGWIEAWLEMAVEEDDGQGGKRRTNRARRERKGTPQGAPISPLLSNIYMRRFILGWKTLGHARRFGAEIANYADDFVVCGRAPAEAMRAAVERMTERLRMPVNARKTRSLRVPEELLEFPGVPRGAQLPQGHGPEIHRHAPERGERPQHLPQAQRVDASAVRTTGRGRDRGTLEPSDARLGESTSVWARWLRPTRRSTRRRRSGCVSGCAGRTR